MNCQAAFRAPLSQRYAHPPIQIPERSGPTPKTPPSPQRFPELAVDCDTSNRQKEPQAENDRANGNSEVQQISHIRPSLEGLIFGGLSPRYHGLCA